MMQKLRFHLAALAVLFVIREIVAFLEIIPLKYLFTPLVTAAVLIIAVYALAAAGASLYRYLVVAGLITSVIADTLLMIVQVDLLKYGIVFFLATHLAYCIAFSRGYKWKAVHLINAAVLAAIVVILHLLLRGRSGGLDAALIVYMLFIACMVYFAYGYQGGGPGRQRVLLRAGATMFMVSDIVLAVNAFLSPIPHSTVFTWALYAPAQLMIALSCHDQGASPAV
ncbi:MAG: lysoplasmalogenase [Spirochaetes bacterium]|nr:lysoplasmalogenase [Spirochaetota bacterium]